MSGEKWWAGQLRAHAKYYDELELREYAGIGLPTLAADLRDAADEIERLRDEIEQLKMRVAEAEWANMTHEAADEANA